MALLLNQHLQQQHIGLDLLWRVSRARLLRMAQVDGQQQGECECERLQIQQGANG